MSENEHIHYIIHSTSILSYHYISLKCIFQYINETNSYSTFKKEFYSIFFK